MRLSIGLFVLLSLSLSVSSTSFAGVAVPPSTRVTCFGTHPTYGSIRVQIQQYQGQNPTVLVTDMQGLNTHYSREASGALNYNGTGYVSFWHPTGLAASYNIVQDIYGGLAAQFFLNGQPGQALACRLGN